MIQNWNIGLPYAFPPFSMISRALLKIKQECVPLLILIAPVWSTQPWYPELLNLCQGTKAAAPRKRNADKPKKYCPPIDGGELIDTGGLVGFRKTIWCEGISENASHIITNSRRKGTLSNYESAWRKWASWCLERKIDPFQTPVKDIIEYLTSLFNYGNEYRTINLHRSAISAFHEYIDGLPVGKHPRIGSLVSGIFNLRPPKPRYMFVWDIKQVLDFLKEQLGDNDQLSKN